MEKEELFTHIRSMIISSTKKPKQMAISSVKMADLFGVSSSQIQEGLNQLLSEGRLQKKRLDKPPFHEVFMLP
ncbi:MAG: hypothetical protein Q8906_02630 [Bacillota bacterium]|nr:hypothetical protein [Bacillota bacterium]MDP4169477.1 hypothetical protein [Bacillota bacterium]